MVAVAAVASARPVLVCLTAMQVQVACNEQMGGWGPA